MKEQVQQITESIIKQSGSLATAVLRSGMRIGEARGIFDKAIFRLALEEADGNVCEVARMFGIHRNTARRYLEDYGLITPRKRAAA